jgi:hypothetical protein
LEAGEEVEKLNYVAEEIFTHGNDARFRQLMNLKKPIPRINTGFIGFF